MAYAIRYIGNITYKGYMSNVLHSNGNLYGIPWNSSAILEFNPNTENIRYITNNIPTGQKWIGAAL